MLAVTPECLGQPTSQSFSYCCSPQPFPSATYSSTVLSIRATRRLLHALLLGHIQSLPTLDDLRSMRQAFRLKASTASRASIGENFKGSSTPKGAEPAENVAKAAPSSAAQVQTLRIAQRHLAGIPFWFEREEHEAGRGGELVGSDSLCSTARAVYTEAWVGDDGRVDGLDLLLTLCAVPGDAVPDNRVVDDECDEGTGKRLSSLFVVAGPHFSSLAHTICGRVAMDVPRDANDLVSSPSQKYPHPIYAAPPPFSCRFPSFVAGVPFSPGLFRAFSMLAETPVSSGNPCTKSSADTATSTVTAPCSKTAAAAAGVLRVSLPDLTAILAHGGGMTPAEVAGVCELVAWKEGVDQGGQRKVQTPETESTTVGSEASATGKDEPAVGLEPDGIISGSRGESEEDDATPPQRSYNELDGAHATGDEFRDAANRGATVDRVAGGRGGSTAEGHDRLKIQDQHALTVSFTTVSECEAVRAWVRRGAYTLPAFDVTSGQRRDSR